MRARLRRGCAALAIAAGAALPPCARAQDGGLAALGDEFGDAGSLARWSLHHEVEGWRSKIKVLDVNRTAAGSLYLEPWPSVWYHDYAAPFLFKEIQGDFVATARLRVSGTRSPYPRTIYSLAGLMARAPRPGGPRTTDDAWQKEREAYLFVATGTTAEPGVPFVETKNAIRSQPLVKHFRLDRSGWMELRLARVGRTFLILFRHDGGEWVAHERADRPDLPARLQVGIMAYGDFGTIESRHWYRPWEYNTGQVRDGREDLRVEVDWIRFTRPPPAPAVARLRERGILLSDHRVSNPELLELLPFLAAR